jgi:aldose 1-epimerase
VELPSGQQWVLRSGDAEAVVTEVGGGVRVLRVAGSDVLDGFDEHEMCDGARGQVLVPWPNRVKDGRYTWQGQEQQLALTEPDRHNAIHGLCRWANWELIELNGASVHLRHRVHPRPGWPFLLRVDVRYALAPTGLTVTTRVENTGPTACPVAAGAHPYLSAGGGLVDECVVTIPGEQYLPTDERGIPVDRVPVAGGDHDFRAGRELGPQQLDVTFTQLRRDPDGCARVTLQRQDGVTAALWADPSYPHLEIFTGDTLAPDRRRRGLGVEPMTAPPNALATGEDLVVLEPGQAHEMTWGAGLL